MSGLEPVLRDIFIRIQQIYMYNHNTFLSTKNSTEWLDSMSDRKWQNGQNGPHWPVLPILPISLFPVRHLVQPPSTLLGWLFLYLISEKVHTL